MTALTADRNTPFMEVGHLVNLSVAASEVIYQGALVCINGSGDCVAAADAVANIFVGVAAEQADNSSGSAGDIDAIVRRKGIHEFVCSGLAKDDVGKMLYATDDQTVTLTANNVPVGRLAYFKSATVAPVEIESALAEPTDAGDFFTINGFHPSTVGASAVKIMEDMEFPEPYLVLAAFANAGTAPGGAYVCTVTLTDGTTSFDVTITGAATKGETKVAGTTLMKADTDTDVSLIDDNASAVTADVGVIFLCRKVKA